VLLSSSHDDDQLLLSLSAFPYSYSNSYTYSASDCYSSLQAPSEVLLCLTTGNSEAKGLLHRRKQAPEMLQQLSRKRKWWTGGAEDQSLSSGCLPHA